MFVDFIEPMIQFKDLVYHVNETSGLVSASLIRTGNTLCLFLYDSVRKIWRYQRGNQNLYIEEEQTTQWPKEKVQKGKQRSIKHIHKTKDRVTRTPLKTGCIFNLAWSKCHVRYCHHFPVIFYTGSVVIVYIHLLFTFQFFTQITGAEQYVWWSSTPYMVFVFIQISSMLNINGVH